LDKSRKHEIQNHAELANACKIYYKQTKKEPLSRLHVAAAMIANLVNVVKGFSGYFLVFPMKIFAPSSLMQCLNLPTVKYFALGRVFGFKRSKTMIILRH
jgi:hypothetical protein